MKKLILFGILNISILTVSPISASEEDIYPKGEDAIYECISKSNITKDTSGVSSIANPIDSKRNLICKGKTSEEVLYQAILDVIFTDIDKKVESYLETLPKQNITVEEGNKVGKKFSQTEEFYKKYQYACNFGVTKYAAEFMKKEKNKKDLKLENLSLENKIDNFLQNSVQGGKCSKLMKSKLKAYEGVAWLILKRNMVDSYKKDKQEFMKDLKKKYTDFIMKLNFYLGQLWVIKDKWNTGNPGANNQK